MGTFPMISIIVTDMMWGGVFGFFAYLCYCSHRDLWNKLVEEEHTHDVQVDRLLKIIEALEREHERTS